MGLVSWFKSKSDKQKNCPHTSKCTTHNGEAGFCHISGDYHGLRDDHESCLNEGPWACKSGECGWHKRCGASY